MKCGECVHLGVNKSLSVFLFRGDFEINTVHIRCLDTDFRIYVRHRCRDENGKNSSDGWKMLFRWVGVYRFLL